MFNEDLDKTVDAWIRELDQYNFTQLCAAPAAESWSMGQVYMHLINETAYYIEQAEICATGNHHAMEKKSSAAEQLFINNGFPDEMIEGPASNAFVLQPHSKEQLLVGLLNIKAAISKLRMLLSNGGLKGKTEHPGLGYFDAGDWLQFASFHFCHHLRQKKRIDTFLRNNQTRHW